jgi:large subunit ribosomal protein L18
MSLTVRQARLRRHRRVRGKVEGTAERPRLAVFRSNRGIYAQLGWRLGVAAKKAGIESAVFDRGGYLYHGRVKALADGARKGGLKF